MNNQRLLSIDIIRGYAIAVILIIHRIHYQWTGMQTREILRANIHGPWAPLIILTIAMFTMAGIFYFISGLVNSYTIWQRVTKDSCNRSKWMWGGVLSGVILIVFNYLHRLFFMNGFVEINGQKEPEFPIGLITGYIRDNQNITFRWSQITEPGTLSLIGFVLIIISLTMGYLLKNDGLQRLKRNYNFLQIMAAIFLLSTPFMKWWLRPVYDMVYQQGSYLQAGCIGHVCQEFCLFPYLGFGFLGAVIGISLARKEDKKVLFRRNHIWMILLLITGITGLLIFDRSDPLGKRILGACVSYIELAIFIGILNLLLRFYDFSTIEKAEKRWKKSLGIRRMGMIALTVYFFEPLLAEILKNVIDLVLGDTRWADSFFYVLIFGFGCLSVWFLIIKYWSRVNYMGSLEWITAWAILRLAGKRSSKTDFRSIHEPVQSETKPAFKTASP